MTKKELIDAIKDMPDDAEVYVNTIRAVRNSVGNIGYYEHTSGIARVDNITKKSDLHIPQKQPNKPSKTMTDKDLQPIAWLWYPYNTATVTLIEPPSEYKHVPLYTLDQAREIIDRENESKNKRQCVR